MKKAFVIILFIFSAAAVFIACSKSDTTPGGGTGGGGVRTFSCVGISPKFGADVQPILTSVCSINSSCHGAGSVNSGGPFTTHAEVFAKKSNIRAAILSGSMPQSGTITQVQVNAFIG